jgi:hypothetical protein
MDEACPVNKSSFIVINGLFHIKDNYLNKINEKARQQYIKKYIGQVFYTNWQAYRAV